LEDFARAHLEAPEHRRTVLGGQYIIVSALRDVYAAHLLPWPAYPTCHTCPLHVPYTHHLAHHTCTAHAILLRPVRTSSTPRHSTRACRPSGTVLRCSGASKCALAKSSKLLHPAPFYAIPHHIVLTTTTNYNFQSYFLLLLLRLPLLLLLRLPRYCATSY
jgi:hypothetical protein